MRLLAVMGFLLLSGCLADPAFPPPDPQVELASYTRLKAVSVFVNHAGAGGVRLVPEDAAPQPSLCVLYRNQRAYGEDSCKVIVGPPEFPRGSDAPWHIEGRWKHSDASAEHTMERVYEKAVIAFHQDYDVLGRWNGTDCRSGCPTAIE